MELITINHKVPKTLDGCLLFRLSNDIYQSVTISQSIPQIIKSLIPDQYSFFVLSGNRFLYPENPVAVSPEKIWAATGNNKMGIFRRQINNVTCTGEILDYTVCATYIGLDKFKEKVAIGIICPADWRECTDEEEGFYQIAGQISRFYDEFSSTSIIAGFLQNDAPYRFYVDSTSIKNINRLDDNSGDNTLEDGRRFRAVEDLISRLIDPYAYIQEDINLDKIPKNIDIKKCTVLGNEFILISLEMADFKEHNGVEYDQLIRNFSHKIKGKLGALLAAAEQLNTQKGRAMDEDDIALIEIIQSATDSINNLVERLHKYSRSISGSHSLIEIDRIISQAAHRIVDSSNTGIKLEMKLALNKKQIEGDEEQIELALGELLDNAVKGVTPDGTIKVDTIDRNEKIIIRIVNETLSLKHHTGYLNESSFFEPFFSLESDKTGMGLTIAGRIIADHGGKIMANIESDNIFQVEIELPVSYKGVGDGD